MLLAIYKGDEPAVYMTVDEMVEQAPLHFSMDDRVPGIEGKAFDLKQWYSTWQSTQSQPSITPTHLTVEAVDQFQATIPWDQLDQAALLYLQNGLPLEKGFPIRLYVPDGSSNCLNVKSIVSFYFLMRPEAGDDAAFGFRNTISTADLKRGK